MTLRELKFLKNVNKIAELINAKDLLNTKDRTLLYGYTCTRETFHVYLKNNEIANYVILDDEFHNDYKLVCLNHFMTMSFKGLTFRDLSKIVLNPVNLNNFKHINYQHRQQTNYENVTNSLIKVLRKKYENDIK